MTKKITRAASRIAFGLQDSLVLGNLDARRDWGFAPEYCEGMWRILQHSEADDFVLATGVTHSVREFIELAFRNLGVELQWRGNSAEETGVVDSTSSIYKEILSSYKKNKGKSVSGVKVGDCVVKISPGYYRPTEVELLIGSAKKAEEVLGWKPKTTFEELVRIMVESDVRDVLK